MDPESGIQQENNIKDLEKLFESRIDSEHLIADVERTPTIWDPKHETYGDKIEKINAWNSILTNYIPYFESKGVNEKIALVGIAERRWRSIRACYRRELNKKNNGQETGRRKEYVHFNRLRFLDSIEGFNKTTNIIEEDYDNGPVGVVIEVDPSMVSHPPDIESPKIKTRKRNLNEADEYIPTIKTRSSVRKNLAEETIDEDQHFLLSLVSEIGKVPVERRLKLQSEILAVIAAAQDIQQSPSYSGPLGTFHMPTYPASRSHQTQSFQIPSESQHQSFTIHVEIPPKQVKPSYTQNDQCSSPETSSMSNESQPLENTTLTDQ